MRYVQRDGGNNIIATFANPQSYAAEALADNHAEVLAFHAARTPVPPPKALRRYLAADVAAVNNTNPQPWFASQGAATVDGNTTYLFEGRLFLANGTTTHTTGVSFGGTATITSIDYAAELWSAALNAIATAQSNKFCSAANNQVLNATSALASTSILIKGIVRINAGGTFIPQFAFSAAPGPGNSVKRGTSFVLAPVGDGAFTQDGPWG